MKTQIAALCIALGLCAPARAETYRCQSAAGGKPVFSDQGGPGCEPMSLRVVEPSADEAAAARARLQRDRDAATAARDPSRKNAAEPPPNRDGNQPQRPPLRPQPQRSSTSARPVPPASYDGPPEPTEIH